MFEYKAVPSFVFSKESSFFWIKYTVNCLFILEETFAVFGSVSGLVTSKMFGFAARVNTYELIREHSVRDSGTKYSLWTPDSCHATKLEHFGF